VFNVRGAADAAPRTLLFARGLRGVRARQTAASGRIRHPLRSRSAGVRLIVRAVTS